MLVPGFGVLLVALALFYAALFVLWAGGLRRVLARVLPPLPPEAPFVSIIVPARDEAGVIEGCLEALLASDYPASSYEVIVVDDFSHDDTAARVEVMQRLVGADRLRLIRLSDRLDHEHEGHKGVALAWGVHDAIGRLILTTDADCRVSPGWISGMARTFDDTRVGFVAGAVRIAPGRSAWGALQALELAGLVGIGAGALERGRPNLCNSAAIGYPRRVFEALRVVQRSPEMPDRVTPWDDELLLMKIADHPTLTARFCPDPGAVVTTDAEPTLRTFWAQRRRWAATGARYPGVLRGLSVRLIWVFYAGLLSGAIALAFVPALWPFVVAAFGLKLAGEGLMLVPILRHLGQMRLLAWWLPGQLLQLPYVVAVGLGGVLGQPSWKGRRFEPELAPAIS
jgi:cellulose synthase/poly-beta-1,6-N-acetylglucosamine synthase-like glycosyltransferase